MSIISHVSPDRRMIDKCGKPDRMQWKLVLQHPHKPVHTLSGQSRCLVYCGGPFLETLPGNWAGTCALVQLAIPFILAFKSPAHATASRERRHRHRHCSHVQEAPLSPMFTLMPLGFLEGAKWIQRQEPNCSRVWISTLLVVHYK
jgi:hypothetical protein